MFCLAFPISWWEKSLSFNVLFGTQSCHIWLTIELCWRQTTNEEVLFIADPPLNVRVEVSYSGNLTLGNSVKLTCSSVANPAAENYTWYKGNGSWSSLVQVGSGQVFSIPSLEPSHLGWYLCKSQNLLGENSSMEVLMMENTSGE